MSEDLREIQSQLCEQGPRPIIMNGMLRQWLIGHFSSADNLEHQELRSRVYTTGSDTGILIEDSTTWKPELTQKRPAVILKRNPWESIKLGISGNISGQTPEGFQEYTKQCTGSHTFFCLSKQGGEVEILAAEVYRFLMHFSPLLPIYFALEKFELLQVGEVAILEEAHDTFVVPISVGYGWYETWLLRDSSVVLQQIHLSSDIRAGL